MTLRAQDNRNNLLLLVRLKFNSTVLIWLSFYEIETRKKSAWTTMTQNTFPVPPVSAYDKWTPEKLKKNHPFFKRNVSFFFPVFFFQEITKLRKYYTRFSLAKSWWPTCCFCVSDSFDEWEKRLGYSSFQKSSDGHSCSGLGFPLWSYNKSQNNTYTIQLLKQRLKDRKWSLDLKSFF